LRRGKDVDARDQMHASAYFVPESKSVRALLEEMQKAKVQIAMVIDEYGGVAGW